VVGEERFELSRVLPHMVLNHARLPISPLAHVKLATLVTWQASVELAMLATQQASMSTLAVSSIAFFPIHFLEIFPFR
jgi:hypothetical protein